MPNILEELGYSTVKQIATTPISTPQEKPPQVAFINGDNWGIVSWNRRQTGIGLNKMPVVTCPVVNTENMDPVKMRKILRKNISPQGVISTPILLVELINSGAEILNCKRAT